MPTTQLAEIKGDEITTGAMQIVRPQGNNCGWSEDGPRTLDPSDHCRVPHFSRLLREVRTGSLVTPTKEPREKTRPPEAPDPTALLHRLPPARLVP